MCSRCHLEKPINSFYKRSERKDGHRSECSDCTKKYFKTYNVVPVKTKRKYNIQAFIVEMYLKIQDRSRGYGKAHYKGIYICQRQDFYKFASENNHLKELYKNWQKSDYQRKHIPSTDRIDNSKGYFLNNIQFLTQSENSSKGVTERHKNIAL